MSNSTSLFSQVLGLLDRQAFSRIVKDTKAERHARGFSSWDQLISMLFCQLAHAYSLREISDGLRSAAGKLNHLGMVNGPSRSTLSYANINRPSETFQLFFEHTVKQLTAKLQSNGQARKPFRFKHKLYSIDATTIDLCLSMYDWAKFRQTKGAVKLHLQLDHDGCLPVFAVMTEGKTSEVKVARKFQFEKGSVVVFDRGYTDYRWWRELGQAGVTFVTRQKKGAAYRMVDESRMLLKWKVASDDIIEVNIPGSHDTMELRRIEIQDPDTGEYLTFLTNNRRLAATTIGEIYRQRWQIELFFKAIKTHLKIKTFLGTTKNAVWIQLWTALLSVLLLKFLQLQSKNSWSFSNLLAMLRFNFYTYRDLWKWLDEPFTVPPHPPDTNQLSLFPT